MRGVKLVKWLTAPPEQRDATPPTPPSVTPPPRSETVFQPIRFGSIYRAVQILTTAVHQLGIDVWRSGKELTGTDIPFWLRVPNESAGWTRRNLMGYTATSLALHGNAYWKVNRDGRNEVQALTPLDPNMCALQENGSLSVGRQTLARKNYHHLRLLHVPGMNEGLGPIQAARRELEGAFQTQQYGSSWYKDTDIPTGILSTDQALTAERAAEYKEVWNKAGHEIRVLGSGLNYSPIALKPKDAQFIESRNFDTTAIARLFGIPPHLFLAAVEGTSMTYQNFSSADLNFMRWTVSSYTGVIEEALTTLATEQTTVRFNLDAVLRPDLKSRYEAHKLGIEAGFLTIEEVRQIEGLT